LLEGLLGPAALAAAWKRGSALSRERAVRLALGDQRVMALRRAPSVEKRR
jgi:hypothetical protein